jgi:pseudo-rSAM protein
LNKQDNRQTYWFYLDNYIYAAWKKDSALLYNPLTGHVQEYPNEPGIVKFLKRLHHPRNLLVIPVKQRDLKDPALARLVRDARQNFMGDLVEQSRSNGKPVQMLPIVKIHRDVERMKRETSRSIGEDMMKYINELNLYLHNQCRQSCSICGTAHRQFLHCAKDSGPKQQLSPGQIVYLLDHLDRGSLDTVNLLGGNPFDYEHWDELLQLLAPRDIKKILVCHYKNLPGREKEVRTLKEKSWHMKIMVDFPLDKPSLEQALATAAPLSSYRTIHFIVKSEEEFQQADALIESMGLETAEFHAYYDGTNENFFRAGVFIDRQSIAGSRPPTRDIHARQMINPLNFGNLTVLANGKVHANVNKKPLGKLGKISLYDMVFKEMKNGNSWRRTRNKVKPCADCLYCFICPPLSNYEYALGRNNLCDITE